jgi:hypothetical protein
MTAARMSSRTARSFVGHGGELSCHSYSIVDKELHLMPSSGIVEYSLHDLATAEQR